jgi:hypothetical protein
MKLTALFTARRGRAFLAALVAREARNYQFDFLKPTHSLFSHFNRLVEQYSKILHPQKEMLQEIKTRSQEGAKWQDLEVARKRARWEQIKREKDKKREDDKEAERSKPFCPSYSLCPLKGVLQLRLRKLTGMTTPSSRQSSSRLPTQLPSYHPR